jgi:hypothetical protein
MNLRKQNPGRLKNSGRFVIVEDGATGRSRGASRIGLLLTGDARAVGNPERYVTLTS